MQTNETISDKAFECGLMECDQKWQIKQNGMMVAVQFARLNNETPHFSTSLLTLWLRLFAHISDLILLGSHAIM